MTNFGSDNSEEMTVFVRPGGRSWRQEQEAGSRKQEQDAGTDRGNQPNARRQDCSRTVFSKGRASCP